jgi:hypothetical protein
MTHESTNGILTLASSPAPPSSGGSIVTVP